MSAEFEHMRQHQQVNAAGGERQSTAVGNEVAGGIEADPGAQGNTVLAQQFDLGQAYLNGVKPEHVFHRAIELRLFPAQHVFALGRGEPIGQS